MSSSASSAPMSFVLQLDPPDASSAEIRHIADLLRKGIISVTEAEELSAQAHSRSLSSASPPPPPINSPLSASSGRTDGGRARAPATLASQPPVMRAFPHRDVGVVHMPATSSLYPEIKDGTYVSHMYGVGKHSWKKQHYAATLVIDQQIPPELRHRLRGPTHQVLLPLLVDTGSSDTWGVSVIHRRIVISRDGSSDDKRRDLDNAASATLLEPSHVVVTTWVFEGQIPRDPRHHNWKQPEKGLLNHGYRSVTTVPRPGHIPVETADERTILGFPRYMNNISLLLALQTEPESFHFGNVYSFGAQSWPSRGPEFRFRFGAALAVPLPMACSAFVGILGLSPAHVQVAFPHQADGRAPSFINMLIEQGGVVPSELHELGIVLYLRMVQPEFRPPGVVYTPSWTAFNVWPCARVPIWSSPIGVYRIQSHQWWCVIVKAVRLTKRYTTGNKEPETRTFQEAFYAVLDSGTSVSYTPAGLIDMIQAQVLGVNRRPVAPADAVRSGSLFFVPAATDSSTFTLEFVFQARNPRDPDVVVPVPIDPFVYTRSPYQMSAAIFPGYLADGDIRESLLWPVSPQHGISISLLGLNFFQAMHVALHKPDPRIANPQQPYVRLAPDWPWETRTYSLPPMAG